MGRLSKFWSQTEGLPFLRREFNKAGIERRDDRTYQ